MREFGRKHAMGRPDLRHVLFLCYGNICRSAFAETYWNSRVNNGSPAQSAGFYIVGNRRTPTSIHGPSRAVLAEIWRITARGS